MSDKTSLSHPLRIDELETPAGGLLGITFCPGKKDRHAAWDRDLDADLQSISAWGAQLLVTLIEDHEFALLQVEPLSQRVHAAGIAWLHLPIRDVGIPDRRFEDGWRAASVRVHAVLEAGGRVVVHCRGGLGRAGMVAARVLIEQGVAPREAVDLVRRVRQGAIETKAQERYVLALARGTAPRPSTREALAAGVQAAAPDRRARIRGCLLGGAAGDAFGYCVEFSRWPEIEARYGAHGLQEPVLHQGRLIVSDDTQMTLFTLEGLLRGLVRQSDQDAIVEEIRRAYVDWLHTQSTSPRAAEMAGTLARHRSLHHARAPGTTCLSALRAGGRGTLERPINDSKGCGGVMRVAPIAFFPDRFPIHAAVELGARAAALTHGHPSGYLPAAALVGILHVLIGPAADRDSPTDRTSGALIAAVETAIGLLHRYAGHGETTAALRQALELAAAPAAPRACIGKLGEGWVGEEALAIALYACLAAADFKDAIRIAANHDGDSDSTASIAGQLYGAWRGEGSLAREWLAPLDVLEPVEELLTQALAHSAH